MVKIQVFAVVLALFSITLLTPSTGGLVVRAAHGDSRPRMHPAHGRRQFQKRQPTSDERDVADMQARVKLAKEAQKAIYKRNQYNPHKPKPTTKPLAKRQNASGAPTVVATVTTGTSTLTFSRTTLVPTTLFTTSTFTNTYYSTRYSTTRNCLLVLCTTSTSTILVPTSTSIGTAVVPTATNTITSFIPGTTTYTFTSTLGQPAVTTAATGDAAAFCPLCTGSLVKAYIPLVGCVCI